MTKESFMPRSLLIQGGTVVDGTGSAPREADVEVVDGKIARVGSIKPADHEVLEARGLLVTPGFVDVHTHYDGHVTWDTSLVPSSLHGVTTAVMGNCGIGFAPCRPEHRTMLIEMMEAIEDIPGPVLHKGLPWNWETFPQFLDALDARRYDIDIAAQLPHGALRVNVMGDRAVRREPSTEEDRAEMARQAGEAIRAGAMGFSTSRIGAHKTKQGEMTPDFMAAEGELQAIADALKKEGRGVLQTVTDIAGQREAGVAEFQLLCRLVKNSGRPLSMNVNQREIDPDGVNRLMKMMDEANKKGIAIKAQVMGRPIGLILGFELTQNPFTGNPSYQQVANLPFPEKLRALRDPQLRHKILSEHDADAIRASRISVYNKLFPIGERPDYEPRYEDSVEARAKRAGLSPAAWAYDFMAAGDGRGMLYRPLLNYVKGNLNDVYDMLTDPNAVPGIGDGGAHCGMTCDASITTFNLAYWTRDRTKGPKLPLEKIVKGHTSDSAALLGFKDRGTIAPGMKADINVIDYDRLRIHPVEVIYDLPGGARRLVQKADGYVATLVSGVPILRNDQPTGARPGRLVRSSAVAG
jgi:N-acyl-D-aspartate/D-glutamate deacylase